MPDQSPAVMLDGSSPSYHTIDAAADAVSRDFAKNKEYESAAVVVRRPDGSYGYSTVAPQHTHDAFALRAMLPKGHTLAGIVHGHPGEDAMGQVFSPQDIGVAGNLKVPSFVRFYADNSIRKFVPGVTHTQPFQVSGNRFGLKSATGDQIDLGQDAPGALNSAGAQPQGALAAVSPDIAQSTPALASISDNPQQKATQ